MPQMPPIWTEALQAAEVFDSAQRLHRADGRVDEEEADWEWTYFHEQLLPLIARTQAFIELAQTIMRRGPESPRAKRLEADIIEAYSHA